MNPTILLLAVIVAESVPISGDTNLRLTSVDGTTEVWMPESKVDALKASETEFEAVDGQAITGSDAYKALQADNASLTAQIEAHQKTIDELTAQIGAIKTAAEAPAEPAPEPQAEPVAAVAESTPTEPATTTVTESQADPTATQ